MVSTSVSYGLQLAIIYLPLHPAYPLLILYSSYSPPCYIWWPEISGNPTAACQLHSQQLTSSQLYDQCVNSQLQWLYIQNVNQPIQIWQLYTHCIQQCVSYPQLSHCMLKLLDNYVANQLPQQSFLLFFTEDAGYLRKKVLYGHSLVQCCL